MTGDGIGAAIPRMLVGHRRYMSLTLTNIPRIMRHHSWNNGARLMDIWFSRPAATAPHYGAPDTATIKMDSWALTFPRARDVYDNIIREKIWSNPAGKREVGNMLRRKGLLGRTNLAWNDFSLPIETLDADYVNFRTIGSYAYGYYDYYSYTEIDDMTAALGRFAFRVVVAGETTPSGTTHDVAITKVGLYIKDSYDFNGDQDLGYWDDSDNSVSVINFLSGTNVSNKSFRDHRAATNMGGDFIVFSDLKVVNLNPPDVFTL